MKFMLRDLFWLMLVWAMGLGWWAASSQQAHALKKSRLETQLVGQQLELLYRRLDQVTKEQQAVQGAAERRGYHFVWTYKTGKKAPLVSMEGRNLPKEILD